MAAITFESMDAFVNKRLEERQKYMDEKFRSLEEKFRWFEKEIESLKGNSLRPNNVINAPQSHNSIQFSPATQDINSAARKLVRFLQASFPDFEGPADFGSDSETESRYENEQDDDHTDPVKEISKSSVRELLKSSGESSKFGKKLVLLLYGDGRSVFGNDSIHRRFPTSFCNLVSDFQNMLPQLDTEKVLQGAYHSCTDRRKMQSKKEKQPEKKETGKRNREKDLVQSSKDELLSSPAKKQKTDSTNEEEEEEQEEQEEQQHQPERNSGLSSSKSTTYSSAKPSDKATSSHRKSTSDSSNSAKPSEKETSTNKSIATTSKNTSEMALQKNNNDPKAQQVAQRKAPRKR